MYFERTPELKASVEWQEWKEFGQLYVDTMQTLHELRSLKDDEIDAVQKKMDRMKVLFATVLTDEGDGTQYFHCMFSGHVRDMLKKYGSLSRLQQQSWEQLMSEMKRMLSRCTTRSGCGQTIVKSLFKRYCRKLMHHLNVKKNVKGEIVYMAPNFKPTIEEARELRDKGDFIGLMYQTWKSSRDVGAATEDTGGTEPMNIDGNDGNAHAGVIVESVAGSDSDSDNDNDNDNKVEYDFETVTRVVEFSAVVHNCRLRSKSV
jgi:hypothetical protein